MNRKIIDSIRTARDFAQQLGEPADELFIIDSLAEMQPELADEIMILASAKVAWYEGRAAFRSGKRCNDHGRPKFLLSTDTGVRMEVNQFEAGWRHQANLSILPSSGSYQTFIRPVTISNDAKQSVKRLQTRYPGINMHIQQWMNEQAGSDWLLSSFGQMQTDRDEIVDLGLKGENLPRIRIKYSESEVGIRIDQIGQA